MRFLTLNQYHLREVCPNTALKALSSPMSWIQNVYLKSHTCKSRISTLLSTKTYPGRGKSWMN